MRWNLKEGGGRKMDLLFTILGDGIRAGIWFLLWDRLLGYNKIKLKSVLKISFQLKYWLCWGTLDFLAIYIKNNYRNYLNVSGSTITFIYNLIIIMIAIILTIYNGRKRKQ